MNTLSNPTPSPSHTEVAVPEAIGGVDGLPSKRLTAVCTERECALPTGTAALDIQSLVPKDCLSDVTLCRWPPQAVGTHTFPCCGTALHCTPVGFADGAPLHYVARQVVHTGCRTSVGRHHRHAHDILSALHASSCEPC